MANLVHSSRYLVKAKFMFRIPNLNLPVEQKHLRLKNCDVNYLEYNTTQQGWKIFLFLGPSIKNSSGIQFPCS